MEEVPVYVDLTFIACVITSLGFIGYAVFVAAHQKSYAFITFIGLAILWLTFTGIITHIGYLQNFETRPPRLMLLVGFLLLVILCIFIFRGARRFLLRMPITSLTYLHIIRVPVEMVLLWLFHHGSVDESMTFEGANFDILSGITAPFAGLFLVGTKRKNRIGAIIWNGVAMILLFNIVIRAILATPYFFDPAKFEQANMAVFYLPYVWLPAFVVPAVLFAHLVSLYQLFKWDHDQE